MTHTHIHVHRHTHTHTHTQKHTQTHTHRHTCFVFRFCCGVQAKSNHMKVDDRAMEQLRTKCHHFTYSMSCQHARIQSCAQAPVHMHKQARACPCTFFHHMHTRFREDTGRQATPFTEISMINFQQHRHNLLRLHAKRALQHNFIWTIHARWPWKDHIDTTIGSILI